MAITILVSFEMPIPSQGHYGFHSFPVVDWFCLFIYLWVFIFPLLDCSEFGDFVITLIDQALPNGTRNYLSTFWYMRYNDLVTKVTRSVKLIFKKILRKKPLKSLFQRLLFFNYIDNLEENIYIRVTSLITFSMCLWSNIVI